MSLADIHLQQVQKEAQQTANEVRMLLNDIRMFHQRGPLGTRGAIIGVKENISEDLKEIRSMTSQMREILGV